MGRDLLLGEVHKTLYLYFSGYDLDTFLYKILYQT